MDIKVKHIVACDVNNAIGKENTIPWRSKLDMAFFKETTMGYPLVMGRKTYESLPGALKGRHLFVITRDKDWSSGTPKGESVFIFHSVEEALDAAKTCAKELNKDTVWIIGGEQIYRETLPFTDEVYQTTICIIVKEPDAFYPLLSDSEWKERQPVREVEDGRVAVYFRSFFRMPPIK